MNRWYIKGLIYQSLDEATYPTVTGPDYDPYPGSLQDVADVLIQWIKDVDNPNEALRKAVIKGLAE